MAKSKVGQDACVKRKAQYAALCSSDRFEERNWNCLNDNVKVNYFWSVLIFMFEKCIPFPSSFGTKIKCHILYCIGLISCDLLVVNK